MNKKMLTILIFSFVCVFLAMSAFASTSLLLAHTVNVPLEYSLSFREYTQLGASAEKITEYLFVEDGRHLFASLYLTFNRALMFDSITVSFTDLVNTADNTSVYPYQMEVLVPGDETEHLVEVMEAVGGHGAGSASIVASATAFKRTNTDPSEDRRLADFAITLADESEVDDGTFTGTVTIDFVAN